MANLIKEVSLVKIAVLRRKDLQQISFCRSFRLEESGVPFQKEVGEERRELAVIGWFMDGGSRFLLLQRVDDDRLLVWLMPYKTGKMLAEQYPQVFIR